MQQPARSLGLLLLRVSGERRNLPLLISAGLNLRTEHPAQWQDYELIDSGDFERLERFGKYILIRPEPQALWKKSLDDQQWRKLAHARFVGEQKDQHRPSEDVKGGWWRKREMPDSWEVQYRHGSLHLRLRLALTNFGHVGMFPEQGSNWNYIYDTLDDWRLPGARVLNLFAYTGAASVVARLAGADVVHCDASRPGLNWANQNMQMNGLSDIRWVYEDAFKFAKRELKRGNRYNAIIMDPPPHGRGPDGERWKLVERLDELVSIATRLLKQDHAFFIMSLYATGLSPWVGYNVTKTYLDPEKIECGEFLLKATHRTDLPMGTFLRWRG